MYLACHQTQAQQLLPWLQLASRINPWYIAAAETLGHLMAEQQAWPNAESAYRRALHYDPQRIDSLNGLAFCRLRQGAWPEAQNLFLKAYQLKRGVSQEASLIPDNWTPEIRHIQAREGIHTGLHKLQHDFQQLAWLNAQMPLADHLLTYQQTLYTLIANNQHQPFIFRLNSSENQALKHYGQSLYLLQPSCEQTLQEQDSLVIQNRYLEQAPGLVVLDQFLTPEALEQWQQFCLNSTIWHDDHRQAGYLASYLDDGLNCPLLFQLAAQLQQAYPQIFKNYPLIYAWAFKYDSHRQGVARHTDSARINVNFWITPDQANHNPTQGGLLVYQSEPPADWDEREIPTQAAISQFLEGQEERVWRVPYRCNRAVIFNSRLIHATEPFQFGSSYPERRINITLLFGERGMRVY